MNYALSYKYNRQIPIKYATSHSKGLWALVIFFMLSTAFFGWLALRNAKMVSCDTIAWDQLHNQRVCQIDLNQNGDIKQ